MKRNKKVIYFTAGAVPTAEERAAGDAHNAVYRNARFAREQERPEPCDAVMGEVPALYNKMPRVSDGDAAKSAAPKAAAKPKGNNPFAQE